MHFAQLTSSSSSSTTGLGAFRHHRSSVLLFIIGAAVGLLLGSGGLIGNFFMAGKCDSSSLIEIDESKSASDDLFPVFHPIEHGFADVRAMLKTEWFYVERRQLRLPSRRKPNAEDDAAPAPAFLSWDWIVTRPHINVLPAMTHQEVFAFLHHRRSNMIARAKQQKEQQQQLRQQQHRVMAHHQLDDAEQDAVSLLQDSRPLLTASSHRELLSAKPAPSAGFKQPHRPYLFPVFVQTKYGYSGNSLAVVGGLYNSEDKGSLKRTAERELREELGLKCDVHVLGRFIVDGNRGGGQFQSHYAKNCEVVTRSQDDKAAADLEKQQLIFVTKDDLLKVIAQTHKYAERMMEAVPRLRAGGGVDFLAKSAAPTSSPPSVVRSVNGGDQSRKDIDLATVDGLTIKEAKWMMTITSALVALDAALDTEL